MTADSEQQASGERQTLPGVVGRMGACVFTMVCIVASGAVVCAQEFGAAESSAEGEQVGEGGNELKFRVIERAGGGETSTEESTEDDPGSEETSNRDEVSVEAVPESLLVPMRQRRWRAAERALADEGERTPAEWFAAGWIAWNREQWIGAESRFHRAIEEGAGLPDFSALYAARSAYKADRYHRAALMASRVSTASSQYPKALYVLGESLHQLPTATDGETAVRVLRAYLRHFPRGPDADRVRLILGDELAAREEFRSAGRRWEQVLREHPTSQWADKAKSRFEEFASRLPDPYSGYAESLPRELQLARWEGLYVNHASETLIAEIPETISDWTTGTRDRCQSLYWTARSFTKLRRHADAIGWYERVLDECEGLSPFERNALYMIGKSQWNAGRLDAALMSFERLWTDFSGHSFADDVMYFAARIHREREDDQQMRGRLKTQLDAYPNGDMAPDARWLLLRELFAERDWTGIIDAIEKWRSSPAALGGDQYSAGRLTYAEGRALTELGRTKEATQAFRTVIETHPLGYYALLSFNRLAELEEAFDADDERGASAKPPKSVDAGTTTDAATSGDPQSVNLCQRRLSQLCSELVAAGRQVTFSGNMVGSQAGRELGPAELLELPRQVTEGRIFETGHRLLAYGALDLAAEQFRELFEMHGNDEDAMWGLARLLEEAGAHSLSHNIPRRRIDGWKRAYPAGPYARMWSVAFPSPFESMVEDWSSRRGLSTSLVWGLMREESGFSPAIGSWAGAVGLMQLMPDTAQRTARRLATSGEQIEIPTRADLTNPAVNIQIGTGYLAQLAEQLDGKPPLMVAGYNAGLGNVTRWLDGRGDEPLDLWVEDIPYGQTRRYVKRVMSSYWAYLWLSTEGGVVPVVEF